MTILVLDIGTTHSKAAIFLPTGAALHIAIRATPRTQHQSATVIPAEALWATLCSAIEECVSIAGQPSISAVGISSMAETGLLVDRKTGQARSPLIPWFDRSATPFVAPLKAHDTIERFQTFGIHPSFKSSVAKIVQLQSEAPTITEEALWLCAADYIAFRLTGCMATDYSLAGRTYAFNLRTRSWDTGWLRLLGLPTDIFPLAQASGTPLGYVTEPHMLRLGMHKHTPVAICGHDHVCAAVAVAASRADRILDSMGTAEALLGASPDHILDQRTYQSGISFGILPLSDGLYWIGGLSASGGSLEWLRSILGDPPLSYAEMQAILSELDSRPGELLYIPYLAGSGPPYPNPEARGALIGLTAQHTRADLVRAVLEGSAFQIESIRRTAIAITAQKLASIVAVGGGTRNQRWLQIKADIAGLPLAVLESDEATLFGAALLAGLGSGIYRSPAELMQLVEQQPRRIVAPDTDRHTMYTECFQHFQIWQKLVA